MRLQLILLASAVSLFACGDAKKPAPTTAQAVANPCAANPCAAKNPCSANPCAGNPCAGNPCAAKNPCSGNPCAGNPCAGNPCAAKNPCAAAPKIETGVDFSSWSKWTKASTGHWVASTHGKRVVTGIYINGNADLYKKLSGAPFPKGFAVAKAQHKNVKGKPGANDSTFVMAKMAPGFDAENGDWYYGMLSYDGKTVTREGNSTGATAFCARCHAGGEHDYIYGAPQ